MRDRAFSQKMSAVDDNLERASSLGADGIGGMDGFDEDARLRGSESSTGALNGENSGIASRFRRKERSKSSSRTEDRPSRSRSVINSASASLSSIPNRITCSMLSSGLIKISE